jgi:SpoVK/Ycf46/Vps4 family AAA+-type ATPase
MDGLLPANNRYLGQHDVQVVEQFLTEINSLHPDNRVFLVGTNHAEDVDTRVLRGGRVCEKLTIPLPNAEHRVQPLNRFLQGTRMQHEVTISDVASQLDGASPADLQAIRIAAKRIAFVRPITTNSRPFVVRF